MGNTSLNQITLVFPPIFDKDVISHLLELETKVVQRFNQYPNLPSDFDSIFVECFEKIIKSLGYKVTPDLKGDKIEKLV